MTALAQGGAGVALVLCLGLLATRQVSTVTILLGAQALAVAASAAARQQLVLSGLTLLINGVAAVWLLRRQMPGFDGTAAPEGGVKTGILIGALLAALSQTQGAMAEPLAVVLLSVLLAATRRHSLLHLAALVSLQNGLVLAVAEASKLTALPAFLPALPYAAALASDRFRADRYRLIVRLRPVFGWAQLATAALLLGGSIAVPLDPIGRTFAPLVAAWGLANAWSRRNRRLPLADRLAELLKLLGMLAAVSLQAPLACVLALGVAMAAGVAPTVRRRLDDLLLGCCATGLALFGLLTLPLSLPPISVAALVFGLTAIIAMVPELGAAALVLLLRLSVHGPWPDIAPAVLTAVSVAGLLVCAAALWMGMPRSRLALMRLIQTALIALVLGLQTPQAALAAAVLLILFLLTDAAVLIARADGDRRALCAATAGLAGIPPLGLFPGLALAAARLAAGAPWLLLPAGVGLAAAISAALPPRWPAARQGTPSLAWLPLLLALAFGYAAPDELVSWLRTMTGAAP